MPSTGVIVVKNRRQTYSYCGGWDTGIRNTKSQNGIFPVCCPTLDKCDESELLQF